ncbi:respiratory burst oxidase [Striga asiatica]|uniref:Respiratory burst oxidase n=1 Tax=Striga asiatica TaxID=4170 RepID=A0A5A7P0N1_STRAF|nr:respiratory burst oxidase [Striga asiatica]
MRLPVFGNKILKGNAGHLSDRHIAISFNYYLKQSDQMLGHIFFSSFPFTGIGAECTLQDHHQARKIHHAFASVSSGLERENEIAVGERQRRIARGGEGGIESALAARAVRSQRAQLDRMRSGAQKALWGLKFISDGKKSHVDGWSEKVTGEVSPSLR